MKITSTWFNGWRIYQPAFSILQPDEILNLTTIEPRISLRNHHRSRVEKVELNSAQFVIKKPNNKNRSWWIRFTTLYRDSEVLLDIKSQLLLTQLNIETVVPVAAIEKRKFGMVIDSSVIYQFREGTLIEEQNYSQMINIMNHLHESGYIHDDPHTKNFLQYQNQVFAIDCKPRKNIFADFGIAHNNVTLARRSQSPDLVYQLLNQNPIIHSHYKWANRLIEIQQFKNSLKSKLRNWLGITRKNKKKY